MLTIVSEYLSGKLQFWIGEKTAAEFTLLYPQQNVYANKLAQDRRWISLYENCLLRATAMGVEVQSMMIGSNDDRIYQVEYSITTNENWQTICCELQSRHSDQRTAKLESHYH